MNSIKSINSINSNNLKIALNNNSVIKGEKKEEVKVDKIESKLTRDGILLKYGDKSKLIKIEGDVNKIKDSYDKVKKEALNLTNNNLDIKKASLKGGLLGGLKGLGHGIMDLAVIGTLTGLGVSLLGPGAFALAPVIGAVYNVKKDMVRLEQKLKQEAHSKITNSNKDNKEINQATFEKQTDVEKSEPFFPFPPDKPANDS